MRNLCIRFHDMYLIRVMGKEMGVEILGISGLCAAGTPVTPQTQHIYYMQSRMHTVHIHSYTRVLIPSTRSNLILNDKSKVCPSGHRNRLENRLSRFL